MKINEYKIDMWKIASLWFIFHIYFFKNLPKTPFELSQKNPPKRERVK